MTTIWCSVSHLIVIAIIQLQSCYNHNNLANANIEVGGKREEFFNDLQSVINQINKLNWLIILGMGDFNVGLLIYSVIDKYSELMLNVHR